MKKCGRCNELKELSEFNKCKSNNDGLQYQCKDCKRHYHLFKKYGLIQEGYESMLVEQNYKCANAGCETMHSVQNGLVVDHDHKTGAVRGLLCFNCNMAEGLILSSPQRALGFIEYLGFSIEKELLKYFVNKGINSTST